MNQREFCVTQSGTISSGGMYGTNITDSYGRIYLAGLIHVLQLYVFLCNGRRKYDHVCSRIFLREVISQ